MPYSQSLFERIRDLLPHAPTKRMFGGIVFFERGMMKVGVFGDAMMVRVGAEAFAATLAEPGVRPLAKKPERMRGYVLVDEAYLGSDDEIEAWIQRVRLPATP
jgi:TfoX/Sxy family transcriptional regulator of competence genes